MKRVDDKSWYVLDIIGVVTGGYWWLFPTTRWGSGSGWLIVFIMFSISLLWFVSRHLNCSGGETSGGKTLSQPLNRDRKY